MYRLQSFPMDHEIHSITEPTDIRAVEILNLYRTELTGSHPTNNLDELNDIREDLFAYVDTYVATEEDRLLGFATFDSHKSHLENIAVKRNARAGGIGRLLVSHVVTRARETEHSHVQLRAILPSVGFYRKLGFVEVDPDPQRHLMPLMRLDITDERSLRTAGLLPY